MNPPFQTVSVVGLGYVGLPLAAILAARGIDVIGVDVSSPRRTAINDGKPDFMEPDLEALVAAGVASGKLRAVASPQPADAFVIAVPTPLGPGHKPDLGYVESAARSIAPVLKQGDLVVLESTCPVGTTDRMASWLSSLRTDLSFPSPGGETSDVSIAYSPERVLPGHVRRELIEDARVVGGLTGTCAERAAQLYRTFVQGECLLTDARTAELVKLAENAFRDVNIAFANELSMICDHLRLDVWSVLELANRHPRVSILNPGPGVGGHCIAVDPWFIVDSAPEQASLIRAARTVNDQKTVHVAASILELLNRGGVQRIACLGLAYKPDIDDLRESPAIEVVSLLARSGSVDIDVVEPHITALPSELKGLPRVGFTTLGSALQRAQAVALLVDHTPFLELRAEDLSGRLAIDTRGAWPWADRRV